MAANGTTSSRNKSAQSYLEIVEQASHYNSRLCIERKMRMPFLDSQTGVAQNNCFLWMNWRNRCTGNSPAQLYTYPAKRWRKKKRAFQFEEIKIAKVGEVEGSEAGISSSRFPQIRLTRHTFDMHQISAVENPALRKDDEEKDSIAMETTKDWYDDIEDISEPPDAGEIDERNYDSSDFEIESYKKKKKKVTKTPRGRKKKEDKDKEVDEKEKPYSCDVCGARYKTRPGLNYHLTHAHTTPLTEEDNSIPSPIPTPSQSAVRLSGRRSTRQSGPPPPPVAPTPPAVDPTDDKASPNMYCDFCLGDQLENKKTGQREELVSCADCGRSGHPSCLQFTNNMIISVKKYPWQCIECKSCGLCGTSDNDDQLLFCDDCDRGYHMYCLNPPLSEPPEGNWSCHLCIQEFHGGKKPEGMQ